MNPGASLYEHFKGKSKKTADAGRVPPPDESSRRREAGKRPAPEGFEKIGALSYRRVLRFPNPLSAWGSEGSLLSARARPEELVFFDTETTGLSGGAGNLAFLLGTGRIEGDRFVVTQHFLADFPGEPEFLSLIRPALAHERVFVSYNGSAFDSHLLVSRYRLHRLEISFPAQYDLLRPARRLWKESVGSCSLKNIERQVLGLDRGEDIDGAEVPERYFRFLRSGDPQALRPVFEHNLSDVLSLGRLLSRIESLLRAPESIFSSAPPSSSPQASPDAAALGALLQGLDPVRAVNFFELAWERGREACGLQLGFLYKRAGRYDLALPIWEKLCAGRFYREAGLELAKYWEHRARDSGRALEVVRTLMSAEKKPTGALLPALERRRKRLERKALRAAR